MVSTLSEINSILFLKTACLSQGMTSSDLTQDNVASPLPTIISEESISSGTNSFEEPWKDILTFSAFVCDMILLSEDSPNIYKFPREQILPCGQDNLFVLPLHHDFHDSSSIKFQLGLTNCIWDVNMTSTDANFEGNTPISPFEVSANTVTFQWDQRSDHGHFSSILMTDALITIDVSSVQQRLMSSWLDRLDKNTTVLVDPAFAKNDVESENTRPDKHTPRYAKQPNPPGSLMTSQDFKKSKTYSDVKNSSCHLHFSKMQFQILQDMVQSELDEIDRLILLVQVITGLLLIFLGLSVAEMMFWGYRASGSKSSAGIPSSIQPMNDEKHDESFRFETSDPASISIDERCVQQDQGLERHSSFMNSHNRNEDHHKETISGRSMQPVLSYYEGNNSGLYLSEAMRASHAFVPNPQTDIVTSTDDGFVMRPIPFKVTPERFRHPSSPRRNGKNAKVVSRPGQLNPDECKRYIAENYENRVDENGARSDEIRITDALLPLKRHDASSFISDYWG